jgi:LysM repeat protein
MTIESSAKPTKLCPTCGTRVNEDAARCLVCGADLGSAEKPAKPSKAVTGSRMPMLTLSLPLAILLVTIFLAVGAALVFFSIKNKPEVIAQITPSATATETPTPSLTPTLPPPTATGTPAPSPTPVTYTIKEGDSCLGIAGFFGVSVNSIVTLNGLSVECFLTPGNTLLIPQPTPTATAPPTTTLSVGEQTEAACEKSDHVVAENETLSAIAAAYGVPMEAIRTENGLPGTIVQLGQRLVIPLCARPTPQGPTPTPTSPPPYAAPNLLLPADGATFTQADDTITLQWATVGTMRENEAYAITVEDVTEGLGRKLVAYVTETKYIIPTNFRPGDTSPHIYRWWVVSVRQTGTNEDGSPIWEPAGAASPQRVFSWTGAGGGTPAP